MVFDSAQVLDHTMISSSRHGPVCLLPQSTQHGIIFSNRRQSESLPANLPGVTSLQSSYQSEEDTWPGWACSTNCIALYECHVVDVAQLLTIQKMIRQWVYRDYYHPNLTSDDFEELSIHAGKIELQITEARTKLGRSLPRYSSKRSNVSWRHNSYHIWLGKQVEADAEHSAN
jgi:hypothetical protein